MARIIPTLAATAVLAFASLAQAGDTNTSYAVETIAYSASSENFYFWLDGYTVPSQSTACGNGTKFGIHVNAANEELIEQVEMAFLSGRKMKIYWPYDVCVGGAPGPHYVKLYR